MNSNNIVYRRITAHIELQGLTRRDVADALQISYGTLHNKLCGITPWTLEEALKLKTLLGITATIEEAFKRRDEGRKM